MAFPNIKPATIVLTSNTPTVITKSLSGREQRTQIAGQYFSFVSTFVNLSESDRKALMGHIASVRGNFSSFTYTFPSDSNVGNSSGVYSGNITGVTASAGATTFSGTITSSSVLVFKAGDIIKFSNHDKVYMVTADATSTGTALNNVSIFPALKTSVSSGSVTHKSVPITVRFAEDATGLEMDQTMYATFELAFVEVL